MRNNQYSKMYLLNNLINFKLDLINNKLLISICFFVLINLACNTNNKNAIDINKLKGDYNVTLTPNISNELKEKSFESSITRLLLSSIDMKIYFLDNQNGSIQFDSGLYENYIDSGYIENIITKEFKYQIYNDSIMYLKYENEYKPWAIFKKFNNTYDSIQLMVIEESEDKIVYNLVRVKR